MSNGDQQYGANSGSRVKKGNLKGSYIRIYHSDLDCHAWRVLTPTEVALYIALRRQYNGGNNGDISATMSTMKHFGFGSSATLAKSLRTLLTVGLIAKTRDTGGLTHNGALCCLYRFTDEPCLARPAKGIPKSNASHDHLRWKSRSEVDAAINAAHAAAKRPNHPNSDLGKAHSKLQGLNRPASISEVFPFKPRTLPPKTSSVTEPCPRAATP